MGKKKGSKKENSLFDDNNSHGSLFGGESESLFSKEKKPSTEKESLFPKKQKPVEKESILNNNSTTAHTQIEKEKNISKSTKIFDDNIDQDGLFGGGSNLFGDPVPIKKKEPGSIIKKDPQKTSRKSLFGSAAETESSLFGTTKSSSSSK